MSVLNVYFGHCRSRDVEWNAARRPCRTSESGDRRGRGSSEVADKKDDLEGHWDFFLTAHRASDIILVQTAVL
jgi:hypothetical protein